MQNQTNPIQPDNATEDPMPQDGVENAQDLESSPQLSAEDLPADEAAETEEAVPAVEAAATEEAAPADEMAAAAGVDVQEIPDTEESDEAETEEDASDGDEADAASDADPNDEDIEEEDPDFRGILEALIFASDEPLTFKQIKELLAPNEESDEDSKEDAPTRGRRKKSKSLTITRVKRAIDSLNDTYADNGRSFRIIEVSGGFAFQTTGEYGAWVGRLFAERSRRRMTQSALETLSIIAFRQPISKPGVEGIRGVNAEYVVKSLLERNLISIVGREDSPGRPLLYGTTKTFLKHFGLSSINDLPKPREIKDLLSSEDELMSSSIDEMDPDKAAALTGVSSQELERLFDNARLKAPAAENAEITDKGDAGTADTENTNTADTENTDTADTENSVDEDAILTAEASDVEDTDIEDTDVPAAPVLRVQFDNDLDDNLLTEEEDDLDSDEDVDEVEVDEMEDDLPADENPFDEESPDEQELI